MVWDGAKAAAILFVAAILQVSIIAGVDILNAAPDLALVTLVVVALLRGSIFGAFCGFWTGLLIDTARLADVLGERSLLLTLVGYWVGRYGETTGRDRTRAPYLAVGVVTVVYAIGELILHFMLGQPAPARIVLVDTIFQQIALNLLLAVPVYAICRRLLRPESPHAERTQEVQLLG
jgi:rod shape-determining protein MreD